MIKDFLQDLGISGSLLTASSNQWLVSAPLEHYVVDSPTNAGKVNSASVSEDLGVKVGFTQPCLGNQGHVGISQALSHVCCVDNCVVPEPECELEEWISEGTKGAETKWLN